MKYFYIDKVKLLQLYNEDTLDKPEKSLILFIDKSILSYYSILNPYKYWRLEISDNELFLFLFIIIENLIKKK